MPNKSLGRFPPQDIYAETSIIGAILLDPDALTAIIQILKPEFFYKVAHADIYRAILDLYEKREPIDLVTLTAALKSQGNFDKVGGGAYLAQVASSVPTSAHITQYARFVRDHNV
jgi:replicative DNA helicase